VGAAFGTVASWVTPGGLADFTSPVASTTAGAVDGNVAGRVGNLGLAATGLNWESGQTLWLRWSDRNDNGNDHGLAIDDLSFAVTPIPEPGTWGLMLAGLAAVGLIARRRA
jgi:hypothetical protein